MQRLSKSFFLDTDADGKKTLLSGKVGVAMQIRDNGYIPKSGLLLVEQFRKLKISGRALDIGTGETGILANCLLALGASEVFASDVDSEAILWARKASGMGSNITWYNCDLFPTTNITSGYFDIIVSNPPQMPMPYEGHFHDYGGEDGRSSIVQIIEKSKYLLSPSGKLILLCFDFLGIEESGDQATIIELAKENGFKTKVLSRHSRIIRKGGKTEENIDWIKKIHPWYSFQRDNHGNYYHEVLILEMSREFYSKI